MRILVTTNAAVGHFLPMAPTVAELVAAGHDVRVGCPAAFAQFVRRAGFAAWACPEVAVRASTVPAPPEDAAERLTWALTLSWPSDCRRWVDSLLRMARRWRPDLVMVEPVEHAGRVVAAALGVPVVVHGWGFPLPQTVEGRAALGIADLYERASTAPQPPALVADLGPASLHTADMPPVRRYGYRPFAVPGQPLPPTRSGTRRVLVTLGTYANANAAARIRGAAVAALDNGADVTAVLGNADRGPREDFPHGVTALDWVDMPAAVAASDLVVHHGGAGTSWTVLSRGKPAVVIPQAGDQFRNAAILSAAGPALVASPDDVAEQAAAIARGLQDPVPARRAATIADDNAAMPTVAALARDIATLI